MRNYNPALNVDVPTYSCSKLKAGLFIHYQWKGSMWPVLNEHYKDKTVSWTSNLYNETPHTWNGGFYIERGSGFLSTIQSVNLSLYLVSDIKNLVFWYTILSKHLRKELREPIKYCCSEYWKFLRIFTGSESRDNWPILLTCVKSHDSMDKSLHLLSCVKVNLNYLSIPKLQRIHC